jgi:acyl-CoA synthetase (AMP-forming)/AMP-acid ligase II
MAADGSLHVLGRRADRIVTGGENVDPLEVERALEALPGVREACVVGVPDEEWGEVVGAAVVVDVDFDADVEAVAAGLRDRLAPFKLPRRLAVVERLPKNALGKADREAVRRLAAEG